MPLPAKRTDQSAAAGVPQEAPTAPTLVSSSEESNLIRSRLRAWGKRFAARLKANALWMKYFLHAGK